MNANLSIVVEVHGTELIMADLTWSPLCLSVIVGRWIAGDGYAPGLWEEYVNEAIPLESNEELRGIYADDWDMEMVDLMLNGLPHRIMEVAANV